MLYSVSLRKKEMDAMLKLVLFVVMLILTIAFTTQGSEPGHEDAVGGKRMEPKLLAAKRSGKLLHKMHSLMYQEAIDCVGGEPCIDEGTCKGKCGCVTLRNGDEGGDPCVPGDRCQCERPDDEPTCEIGDPCPDGEDASCTGSSCFCLGAPDNYYCYR